MFIDILHTSSIVYWRSLIFATRLSTFFELRHSFTASAKIITPLSAFCQLRHLFTDIRRNYHSFICKNFVTRLPTFCKIITRLSSVNFVDFLQTSFYRFSSNLVTHLSAFIKLRFSFFGFLQTSSLVCRHSAKLSLVYRHSANFVTRLNFDTDILQNYHSFIGDLQTSSLVSRHSANFVIRLPTLCKLRHSFIAVLQTSFIVFRLSSNFVSRLSAFFKFRHSFTDILQNYHSFIGVLQTSSQLTIFFKLRHKFIGFLQT